MTPWWLRPTADSEKTGPGPAKEGVAPSQPEPAPEPAPQAEKVQAPKEPAKEAPKTKAQKARTRSKSKEKPAEAQPAPDEASAPAAAAKRAPARKRRPEPAKRPSREPEAAPESAPSRRAPRSPAIHEITPDDIAAVHRELSGTSNEPHPESVPERNPSVNDERKIAMFCDLENIALGVRDSDIKKFDINLVLERLLEKGKIIVKRAYCDWERYSDYKRPFHEAAIELLDIPQKYYSGKNSADIKMVVDAMDLCYAKEHLDTFVIVSGDSDFSPLVSKLKENDKYVIGIGVKNSSSNLLVDNCDEFIYYEDIWRDQQQAPQLAGLTKKTAEAFSLMTDSIQALIRENKDVLWGSMIKQTMQRKRPSFNEGYYGYNSFSELLEDAEKKNVVKLKKDQRSGSYVVTGFAKK